MNINIKTTQISLTDALREYVTKKCKTFERFVMQDTLIEVEIGKTTHHHTSGDIFRAEIMISMKGGPFRAVSETADLYASIDDARDEMERILVSRKDKKMTLWKKGKQQIKDMIRGFMQ